MRFAWRCRDALIEMEAETVETPSSYTITGRTEWVDMMRRMLSNSYGLYGRSLSSYPAPIDLHAAIMWTFRRERPELVEGQEAIDGYRSNLPDGVVP